VNDRDEKTFLLAEALGEADEKFIDEAEKEYSPGRKRAQIALIIILCAALVLGGVSSLAAKKKAAKRGLAPLVTFSDLAPQEMTLTKWERFTDAQGELRALHWTQRITDETFQRRVLQLLDEAQIKTAREEPRQAQGGYVPSDSVHLVIHEDELTYDISISYRDIRSDAETLETSIGVGMEKTKKHKAGFYVWQCVLEREPFERLFEELWEYSGGQVTMSVRTDLNNTLIDERALWTRPDGNPLAPDTPVTEADRGGIWDEFRAETGK